MPPPQLIELSEQMRNDFLSVLNTEMNGKLKPGVITSIKHMKNPANDIYTIRLGLSDGDFIIFAGKVYPALSADFRVKVIPTLDAPYHTRNQFEEGVEGNAAYQAALDKERESESRLAEKLEKIYNRSGESWNMIDLNKARSYRKAILQIGATALQDGSVSTTKYGGKRNKKTRRMTKRKRTRRHR